ncbi:efflux RND transporter periplasmic adaptor subunit [soil metagenome]
MLRLLRRPSLWAAAAVLVAAAITLALRARGPMVQTTSAVRKRLEQHVIASGRVWVPTRVQVSAQVPGLVVTVGAIEGQHVTPNTVLVQIDDAEARASAAQAKAAVDQATARVDQLRKVGAIVATEGLKQAQSNLEHAQADVDRATKLVASGAVPPIELENARRSFEVARAQKNAAEAQQISSTPVGADSRIALTALLQAQAQLTAANVRLSQTRTVTLASGVVLTRSVEPGDVVQPGRTLLVMAVDADAQIVFQPDERNLANMKLGQKARTSADAFPQQVVDAEVSYIAPSVDPQRGSVEVRLRVASAPASWKPDMTVSVDLTVAVNDNALTLSPRAVRGATSESPYVLTVEGGRVARRAVTLGLRGDGSLEISSGLATGDEVILTDGQVLRPGQRVRTTASEER